MKELFCIFFSAYFLFGGLLPHTDFQEIVSLKEAMDHYDLHQQEARLIGEPYSIWSFVDDHFINPDQHKHSQEDDGHQKLPIHNCHTHSLNLTILEIAQLAFHYHNEESIAACTYYHASDSAVVLVALERPPRFV